MSTTKLSSKTMIKTKHENQAQAPSTSTRTSIKHKNQEQVPRTSIKHKNKYQEQVSSTRTSTKNKYQAQEPSTSQIYNQSKPKKHQSNMSLENASFFHKNIEYKFPKLRHFIVIVLKTFCS